MYKFVFGNRAPRIVNLLWERAIHGGALASFSLNCGALRRAALALAAALAFSASAAAQTWTGAASTFNKLWNDDANWTSPSQVPNSPTADVVFAPSAANFVGIPGTFQVRSLTFASGTNSYVLAIPLIVGPKILTDLRTITVADNVTTTQQISLGGDATGSLVFQSTGIDDPAALTIANNARATAVANPTLLIGPFTAFGTPHVGGIGGITFTGTGTTTFSGSFATSASNQVVGGLTKTGPGTLTLSGSGAELAGGLTLAGGTLRLDYSTNTSSKLGGGALKSSGGDLILVPHASTNVTQNVTGTALTAGHTEINASQAGGLVTIGLGAISRSGGATLNFSGVSLKTSTGNTRGLLGDGSAGAFSTYNGQLWVFSSGGSIFGTFGQANLFAPGTNTDITTAAGIPSGFTTNSLRFAANGLTLNLSGTNTIQSGGILLPSGIATATINGGTVEGVIAHVYGSDLTIGSNISAANGITKTGPGMLTLDGDNIGLNGPVNVNRSCSLPHPPGHCTPTGGVATALRSVC